MCLQFGELRLPSFWVWGTSHLSAGDQSYVGGLVWVILPGPPHTIGLACKRDGTGTSNHIGGRLMTTGTLLYNIRTINNYGTIKEVSYVR